MTIQPGQPLNRTSTTTITNNPIATVEQSVSVSTEIWARDLRSLFEHAKERFGDVSWESEDGHERIWAHKSVIYARAPKAFKERYFISRPFSRSPTSLRSPSPHHFTSPNPYPSPSPHLLPPLFIDRPVSPPSSYHHYPIDRRNGTSSSLSIGSFASEGTIKPGLNGSDGVLRLTHGDTPELFRAQLEWLYTGEGFGDVVEWISAEGELGEGESIRDSLGRRGDIHERRDKLGQDLTYMWRSKLYADVRIHLEPGPDSIGDINDNQIQQDDGEESDSSTDSLSSTAIFTSHRFILASRSPYFASVLLNPSDFKPSTADIHLPTPPFTPAALHFCLGYLYAGHLDFSNRTFDLSTSFQIHKASAYLQLESLIHEVESRIVHDFCHGLDWSKCHCRKCSLRAVRVWKFASEPDVGALRLANQAKTFLIRAGIDCWSREVGLMEKDQRDILVQDVVSDIRPSTVISTIRSLRTARNRLESALRAKGREAADWVNGVENMLEVVENQSRNVLVERFSEIAEGAELWNLVSTNEFGRDLLEDIMKELVEGVGSAKEYVEAPKVYQALVSAILLKVDPRTLQAALPARSISRHQVELAREGVLAIIKRRWMQIRELGGFGSLETWSLKEISDEIEVPLDDLLGPSSISPFVRSRLGGPSMPRTTSRIMSLSDAGSVHSSLSAACSRPSISSRARTPVSSTARPTTPEANGLKRLRLSSSASTASIASSSRSISRPPQSSTQSMTGPSARSPTAAKAGTTVSVGPRSRAVGTLATRSGSSSPSPATSIMARPTKSMTGPPRPLMTRSTPIASQSHRSPSMSSVRTNKTVKSTMSASQKVPTPPSKPPLNSDSTSTTNRLSLPGPSRSKTPTPSIASARARTASASSKISRPTNSSSVPPLQPASRIPPLCSPQQSVLPTRLRTPSTAKSTASKASNPTDKATTPASHARSPSAASLASTRSKAPTLPSKSPASNLSGSTRLRTTSTTSATTKVSTPSLRASVSTSTLRTPATSAKFVKPPLSALPTGRSVSAPKGTGSSVSPAPSSLLRQASTSSLRSVATTRASLQVPPVPPVPVHHHTNTTVRSPSGSTDNAPEPRTPRLSDISAHDHVHIRQEGSESSSVDFPGFSLAPAKGENRSFPPISMPRPVRQTSTASTRSTASKRPHPTSAFDPPRREIARAPIEIPKLEITDGSVPFSGPGMEIRIGIPCIVSLEKRRARFRAVVRYIGLMNDSLGPWVGIEVEDLSRLGIDTLPRGSKDGIHYFHAGGATDSETGNRTTTTAEKHHNDLVRISRKRKVEAIRDSLVQGRQKDFGFNSEVLTRETGLGMGLGMGMGFGLGLGLPGRGGSERGIKRSVSPLVVDFEGGHGMIEKPRVLFVRPSEVLFVIGAE